MSKTKIFATLAATLLITGTAHSIRADETPAPEAARTPEELQRQQEEFLRSLKQTWNDQIQKLAEIDQKKLIIQSAPFAVALSQNHPVTPGMMVVHNAPCVAAQYQRLMREWNRYELLVFLESAKQYGLALLQPPGVVSLACPLAEGAKPLVQVMGQILLPDVKISMEKVNQFLKQLEAYQPASPKAKLVRQD